MKGKVLLVDDDYSMRTTLGLLLKSEGLEVTEAKSQKEAISRIGQEEFDLVVTDLRMEHEDSGIRVLRYVREVSPETEVLVITAYGSIRTAIDATRLGAYDYITTPCENDEILLKVQRALQKRTMSAELESLRLLQSERIKRFGYDSVIAVSKPMRRVMELVKKVAPTQARVLIVGESGTGKELLARVIHYNGPRAKGPFVALNCAAIPETLLESELFGIKRGTATGVSAKQGKFSLANRGTIFLDEIADMSPSTQAKVLRVLQEQEFTPLGGDRPVRVDVRVISATNRDLKKAISDGSFREDLLFRLNIFTIKIPPLRERPEDIIPLADFCLRSNLLAKRKGVRGLTQRAKKALLRYPWPGNVRELENVIQRAVIISSGDMIDESDLALELSLEVARPAQKRATTLKENERQHIISVLQMAGGNRAKAARILGISRSTLWAKMKQYGIAGEPS